jgi:hypothetical protein
MRPDGFDISEAGYPFINFPKKIPLTLVQPLLILAATLIESG